METDEGEAADDLSQQGAMSGARSWTAPMSALHRCCRCRRHHAPAQSRAGDVRRVGRRRAAGSAPRFSRSVTSVQATARVAGRTFARGVARAGFSAEEILELQRTGAIVDATAMRSRDTVSRAVARLEHRQSSVGELRSALRGSSTSSRPTFRDTAGHPRSSRPHHCRLPRCSGRGVCNLVQRDRSVHSGRWLVGVGTQVLVDAVAKGMVQPCSVALVSFAAPFQTPASIPLSWGIGRDTPGPWSG